MYRLKIYRQSAFAVRVSAWAATWETDGYFDEKGYGHGQKRAFWKVWRHEKKEDTSGGANDAS